MGPIQHYDVGISVDAIKNLDQIFIDNDFGNLPAHLMNVFSDGIEVSLHFNAVVLGSQKRLFSLTFDNSNRSQHHTERGFAVGALQGL